MGLTRVEEDWSGGVLEALGFNSLLPHATVGCRIPRKSLHTHRPRRGGEELKTEETVEQERELPPVEKKFPVFFPSSPPWPQLS